MKEQENRVRLSRKGSGLVSPRAAGTRQVAVSFVAPRARKRRKLLAIYRPQSWLPGDV